MRTVMREVKTLAMIVISTCNNKLLTFTYKLQVEQRKKNATVIDNVATLSGSTYHEPLQQKVHEKQLLCWGCQK